MKRAFQIALALMAATMLAGCEPSAQERFDLGSAAFAAHDYATARFDLVSVLQEQPSNVSAMDMLARSYLALGDPRAAVGMLDRMQAAGKPPADLALMYGEADVMLGNFDAVLTRMHDRREADAWRIAALAHIGKGDAEAAQAAFTAGLGASGPKGRLHADYAVYLLGKAEPVQARKFAARSVASPEKPLSGYLVTADIARMDGKLDQALKWYDKALSAYPGNRVALLAKIDILWRQDTIEAIRPLVADALRASPDDADFVYLDARLAAEDGAWAKVRERLQPREIEIKDYPEANLLYARALLKTGQPEQARVLLLSQLLRDPESREVRVALGEAKLAAGDAAGAVETLRPLVALKDLTRAERTIMTKAANAVGLVSLTAL
ncbi:MAG TPA: tetratricopeptide repeat protein [Novosphingobium sp.]|nr:tetratricopeptide repeat protein [Novosphingobium sp.]